MKAPTGKLAFAYRTIAALEAERDALRADVERLEASNEHLELHLADSEHQAEIAGRNASGFEDRMGSLQVENGKLRAEVEALRHLAGELYQVLGALDAPAGALDAVLAAAHGESMEGRGSLLPFVSEEHEALRKDAERYRWLRDQASLEPFGGWAYDLPAVDAWDCKPGPQLNEQFGSFDEAIDAAMRNEQ